MHQNSFFWRTRDITQTSVQWCFCVASPQLKVGWAVLEEGSWSLSFTPQVAGHSCQLSFSWIAHLTFNWSEVQHKMLTYHFVWKHSDNKIEKYNWKYCFYFWFMSYKSGKNVKNICSKKLEKHVKSSFFYWVGEGIFLYPGGKIAFLNNLPDLGDYDVMLNKQIHQHKFPLAAKAE